MAFLTGNDLRSDALWLAGETPDTNSPYYSRTLDYLTSILQSLVTGGSLGPEILSPIDWWWARAFPRGTVRILPAVTGSGTLTLTQGNPFAVFSTLGATQNLLTATLKVTASPNWLARVIAHDTGVLTAQLDRMWPYATTTLSTYQLLFLDYALPANFLRFVTPLLQIDGREPVRVIDMAALEGAFPLATVTQDFPAYAALATYQVSTDRYLLRFSHYPDNTYDLEFDHLALPDTLTDTSTPPLPSAHRRILSFGAAYLILLDKTDANAVVRYQQFTSAWGAMASEHSKQVGRGGELFGRLLPRRQGNDRPLRTASGLIIG